MAGEGAFQFGPLHQCTWKTDALVLERGPVLTLGAEEEKGPAMKGSSTKRKAEVAALPAEDRRFKGQKPPDVMSAAAGGEDEAAKTAAGKEPTAAGMILNVNAIPVKAVSLVWCSSTEEEEGDDDEEGEEVDQELDVN